MCSLIVLAGFDPDYPILVAANRDELRDRQSSPPGLYADSERRRVLSPRDRVAGGTWIGVDDSGRFAALTNLFGEPVREGAPTRGRLVHVALDAEDGVDAAIDAVESAVADGDDNGFQLLVSDGATTRVLTHPSGAGAAGLERESFEDRPHVAAISNEHRPGRLVLGSLLEPATAPGITAEDRLDRLEPLLRHKGDTAGVDHKILKDVDPRYGTVSGSLIALHRDDPSRLVWRFAAGMPGVAPWRNYGNLGRRLVEG